MLQRQMRGFPSTTNHRFMERIIESHPFDIWPVIVDLASWPEWMPWLGKATGWSVTGEGIGTKATFTLSGKQGTATIVSFTRWREVHVSVTLGSEEYRTSIILKQLRGDRTLVLWGNHHEDHGEIRRAIAAIHWFVLDPLGYRKGLRQLAEHLEKLERAPEVYSESSAASGSAA